MRRLFKSAVAGPKTAAPQPVVMAAKEKVGRTRSREDFWTRGLEQKKIEEVNRKIGGAKEISTVFFFVFFFFGRQRSQRIGAGPSQDRLFG